ncbi:acyltransferase [Acidaminobacter sp. JC074]|uniref:acyltransferase n=1 Tax=Acidaminobacter sp. JC074 TaxID=2530199 RepID=UPI001F0DBF04|nr:acyltransferase [Acidaminobacter sp. JC074]MCH4890657.1 acyltransferase [Acidaminobacter sp. JC074]
MNYVLKNQILRLRCALIPSARGRTKWIRKNNFFSYIGDNVHFQPRILPADPKFVKIHNNVAIASNVSFTTHDIIHKVFSNLGNKNFQSHVGCIEIMDNVFIGTNVTIMPNVRIGPNVIVAAGSVITKDVGEGVIVGGVPAKVIGTFDDLYKTRLKFEGSECKKREDIVDVVWNDFYNKRDNSNI